MRPLLIVLLPIAVPLALYFGYAAWRRRRDRRPPMPWPMIAGVLVALLMLAGAAVWVVATDSME